MSKDQTLLDPARTALVMIDLQNGILAQPLHPRSGDEVLENARGLIAKCRATKAPIVLVRVYWSSAMADAPHQMVDLPSLPPKCPPEDWGTLVDGLVQPGDIVITKHQWGAFYGTELDLQLRRRGVDTIILGGVVTNFGVESTARSAWEHGYNIVIAEDTTATKSVEMHQFSITEILPRIARIRHSTELTFATP
ncbi:hydrolase [Thalassospira australica]|uniref:hydrolase n=1 Tax=Thalassospira australica TaxID=1528106 RepID=UPI00385173DE